jgi:hypothetical protein
VTGSLANAGLLVADGGSLTLNGVVSGLGSAKIAGGGTLAATVAFGEDVAFAGAGRLALSDAQVYAGKISGFAGADSLELGDIGFVSASEATFGGGKGAGTLTVTDGSRTAKIKLVGDYSGVSFVAASDGHGGTLVTEQAAAVHRLISASAALPSGAGPAPPADHWTTPPATAAGLATIHAGGGALVGVATSGR